MGVIPLPPFPLGLTDVCGRLLVCAPTSPDGRWHVRVYGPDRCGSLYAYARHSELEGYWCFPLGRDPEVGPDRISFDWNLPRGSRGLFIDERCWALYSHRPLARVGRRRIHSRSGPRAAPFTRAEMRFLWARRRGQRKGGKGFVIEE